MKRVSFSTREEVEEAVAKKDGNNNNNNKNKKSVKIQEVPTITVPTLRANDVINIKMVWDAKDIPNTGFQPEFTHQIFEDEEIKGYDNLKIDLLYDVSSMLSFLSVEQSGGSSSALKRVKRNCTNIQQCFATFFPQPPLDTFDFFKGQLNEKVTPPVIKTENFIEGYKNGDIEFEVHKIQLGQGNQKIEDYHHRASSIAIFYIETAQFIETDDPNWTVYYLYEKRATERGAQYGLAGFCTLYSFYHHPSSTRQRISQFIIFPPYQKKGHGASLLNIIYNDLKKINLFDMTVEDPSPDFQKLRDRVDMQNILKGDFFKDVSSLKDTSKYAEIRLKLFLFKDQIRRCHEIYELMLLKNKKDTPNYEAEYKEYRLKVKRRLLKKYMDTLNSVAVETLNENEEGEGDEENEEAAAKPAEVDPELRKKQLQELFEELENEYLAVISKL
eukprot:TRINITY_DN4482_c0_g1_i1.p1 TRINITY_DN4482_c0_g1~~TRINITY_DN4482_c0_g1_i1.p1  ORF type:complete len:443 (+),score=116.17 TRINITY_DN4482_c0_g1_i1:112-1440(+)